MRGSLIAPGTEARRQEGVLAPKRGFVTTFGPAATADGSPPTPVNTPPGGRMLYVKERKSSNCPNLAVSKTPETKAPWGVLSPPLVTPGAKTSSLVPKPPPDAPGPTLTPLHVGTFTPAVAETPRNW